MQEVLRQYYPIEKFTLSYLDGVHYLLDAILN